LYNVCMRIYRQRYEFRYIDPKTGGLSPFTKCYKGRGLSKNGALNSAIRQFKRHNKFLFMSHDIVEIRSIPIRSRLKGIY